MLQSAGDPLLFAMLVEITERAMAHCGSKEVLLVSRREALVHYAMNDRYCVDKFNFEHKSVFFHPEVLKGSGQDRTDEVLVTWPGEKSRDYF